MKRIVILMAGFLVISCGSKKSTSTYVKEKDSISYVLPTENILVIKNLCDSIRQPLDIVKTINTGVTKSRIQIQGNTLTVVTETDTIYKDRYIERIKTVKETKEVPYTPKWIKTLIWLLLSYTIISIAFPIVPQTIKNFIKRLLIPIIS